MKNLLSQINLAPEGGFKGIGPLGLENKSASEAPAIFNQVISTVVGVMTVIAIIWAIVQLVGGTIGIISSGGDKAKLAEARTRIITGITGLVVVVAAIFILSLLGSLIGIDVLKGTFLIPSLLEKQ